MFLLNLHVITLYSQTSTSTYHTVSASVFIECNTMIVFIFIIYVIITGYDCCFIPYPSLPTGRSAAQADGLVQRSAATWCCLHSLTCEMLLSTFKYKYLQGSDNNISQGSVATRLSCDVISLVDPGMGGPGGPPWTKNRGFLLFKHSTFDFFFV